MSTTPNDPRRQRADARRNVSAILDAAVGALQQDPSATLAQIATAAGVGRITVYGHFKSRAELIEAVVEHTMQRADAVLDDVDLSGDPAEALARLMATSWRIVEQFSSVLQAAQRELTAERIRAAHDRVVKRIAELIDRGREDGTFRTDVPTAWLVTVALSLVHAAAEEVGAGHLDGDEAGWYVVTTLQGAFATPQPR